MHQLQAAHEYISNIHSKPSRVNPAGHNPFGPPLPTPSSTSQIELVVSACTYSYIATAMYFVSKVWEKGLNFHHSLLIFFSE